MPVYHAPKRKPIFVRFLRHFKAYELPFWDQYNITLCITFIKQSVPREHKILNILQGDQKVSVHLTFTVQKTSKNTVFQTVSITYHDNVVSSRRLSTPNGTVTLLYVPSLCNWKKIKLRRPTFSGMALQLIQRTYLWHSWTTSLLTESFLKPFGLQVHRIFLRPKFFSGMRWQTQCIRTIPTQLVSWRRPSQNTFGMWSVLYWTRSSRTQFGVSINVWRLAGDILNINYNFLYCNQVHREFLITLY